MAQIWIDAIIKALLQWHLVRWQETDMKTIYWIERRP